MKKKFNFKIEKETLVELSKAQQSKIFGGEPEVETNVSKCIDYKCTSDLDCPIYYSDQVTCGGCGSANTESQGCPTPTGQMATCTPSPDTRFGCATYGTPNNCHHNF